ncbi:MAG: universal stress protein [Vicinamibacterales bacterium]
MTSRQTPAWQCPPRSVLAALDFEPASARAVALAGFVAAGTGATLRVVHAERFEAPPYFTPEQIARLEDERLQANDALVAELRRVVDSATAWTASIEVSDGPPVETILRRAQGADLLVLGTHGRRGPSRWWLGSVAERVVRGAEVPVLVTRADAVPLPEVFARVALVGDGAPPDDDARSCATSLVAALGGEVILESALESCQAGALDAASLVVVAGRQGRSRWGLSDVVTDTLGLCAHPVLFLPAR